MAQHIDGGVRDQVEAYNSSSMQLLHPIHTKLSAPAPVFTFSQSGCEQETASAGVTIPPPRDRRLRTIQPWNPSYHSQVRACFSDMH